MSLGGLIKLLAIITSVEMTATISLGATISQIRNVGRRPPLSPTKTLNVLRSPDWAAEVWMSLIPFFAPIVMFARIVVQTPPLWQILLSLVLLVATVAGLLVLCARIYRIGVLIYEKRPTLSEIMKWLKYAKA